jgi:hypothetical protein
VAPSLFIFWDRGAKFLQQQPREGIAGSEDEPPSVHVQCVAYIEMCYIVVATAVSCLGIYCGHARPVHVPL